MDPDRAAAIVQKLPEQYVAQVFAVMPSDQVGEIMNVLPPQVSARLAQVAHGEGNPAVPHGAAQKNSKAP
jgi:flagellar motility protein MotE (MotC chaperone)